MVRAIVADNIADLPDGAALVFEDEGSVGSFRLVTAESDWLPTAEMLASFLGLENTEAVFGNNIHFYTHRELLAGVHVVDAATLLYGEEYCEAYKEKRVELGPFIDDDAIILVSDELLQEDGGDVLLLIAAAFAVYPDDCAARFSDKGLSTVYEEVLGQAYDPAKPCLYSPSAALQDWLGR